MIKPALLVLEDGTKFVGQSIGITGSTVGEVVFNTSMTGYQEILTDPSYSHQIITLTYSHIGNVGTNKIDEESSRVHAKGLIIRDLSLTASNFRNTEDLSSYLIHNNIVAISDIDTRKLTHILRKKGSQRGCILSEDNLDQKLALKRARTFSGLSGLDLAKEVTTSKIYHWKQGSWRLFNEFSEEKKENELPFHVVVYDYGAKRSILRTLVDKGCRLTVVPAQTPVKKVLAMNPDGIFLSNGPGDPTPCTYAIEAIKVLLNTNIPIFGICLGHQLLALASGAKTIKMKFGHHGINHPVKDIDNNIVMITAQNHGFVIDEASLPAYLRITHISLFDGTLQGIHHIEKPIFSFQGHPEGNPGPHDARSLFDHFIELIQQYRQFKNS